LAYKSLEIPFAVCAGIIFGKFSTVNSSEMKIAVIDLGTNTFNLLVAELNSLNHYRILYNTKFPVMLGKGGINKGMIRDEAMERGVSTLKKYLAIINSFGCERVFAYATSAVRNAVNGHVFTDRVNRELGIEINVISGDKEAELIYRGVKLGTGMRDEVSLIMDIGGGSIEFVICNNYQIFWKKSFEIGAARILEKFQPSNPIKLKETEAIEQHLENELCELFEAVEEYNVEVLIGSSGSFDTFAEIIAHKFYEPSLVEDITEYEFYLNDFFYIHNLLLKSSKEERLKMPGLIPMRVDMIVIASIFVNTILNLCKIRKMKLSTYSLKEGVLNELLSGVEV
jgi:exopolyphosphatase / guanosine-5'-triphosphate,3'-diphosphate pyrophosphatase